MDKIPVRLERAFAVSAEIRDLIGELDAELGANYKPEQRHAISLDALCEPHMRFFTAWTDAGAQGCGGVALFSDFAELKRMYVRGGARGRGIADALLAQLTVEAAAAGLKLLRLETGILQARALRFYQRHGFAICAAYEPYASMPPAAIATSIFMQRRIQEVLSGATPQAS
jgi:putative acetyltransferase